MMKTASSSSYTLVTGRIFTGKRAAPGTNSASDQRGGETFFSNPTLAVPALLMGISGILAFVTGAISIFRNKERSITVFLSTALGLFVLIFWLGEILVPH